MKQVFQPLLVFQLPEWAKWHAWIQVSTKINIQVLNLKYPRWDMAFYPIFLDQNNQPVFDLEKDLSSVVNDGRIWHSCPSRIYYSESSFEIIVDTKWEADHPRPARAQRQLVSLSNFEAKIIESKIASYGNTLTDPAGDIVPQLSAMSSEFKKVEVIYFEGELSRQEKIELPWKVETIRKKSLKKS